MKEIKFDVKKVRLSRNITQVELSEMTGISQQLISSYELEKNIPLIDNAKIIADALGVTVDELIVIKDAKEKIADKLSRMVNEYEDK